ncbi:hypothetical protein N0V82_006001 [Gnomoniopsis sp. IMI 355080]|nr:hypothetical protein N0V82_006001 [Gnomoniopsis sp. IMI 355080]
MLQRLGLLMHRVSVPTTSWLLISLATALIIEVCIHLYSYQVPIPDHDLDAPFSTTCQEPDPSTPRENAVLVMLARNSELEKAKSTVESVERAFNRWYNYPIVFLNDEPWSNDFVQQLNETSSGLATFEVIPESSWGFPAWVDVDSARQAFVEQGKKGIPYAGREGYHHMCRFFSGYLRTFRDR